MFVVAGAHRVAKVDRRIKEEEEKERTWEEGATSHWMVADQGALALDLRGHFPGDVRWKRVRGVQPHDGKRMQGRDLGAKKILSDHGLCTICAD